MQFNFLTHFLVFWFGLFLGSVPYIVTLKTKDLIVYEVLLFSFGLGVYLIYLARQCYLKNKKPFIKLDEKNENPVFEISEE